MHPYVGPARYKNGALGLKEVSQMRTRVLQVAVVIVLALAFAACGSSSKKSSGGSTATTAANSGGGLSVTTAPTTGTTVNVTVGDTKGLSGPMTMKVDKTSVPAGDVTFVVKNNGTIDHEMVVLKTTTPYNQLKITTFDGEPNRVDESSSVGETGDPPLKPGESRTFTVKNMTAGSYALVCNIAKHYGLGMRAPLTVT